MPTVAKNLIIINVLLFFGQSVAQSYGTNLPDYLGFHSFLTDNFNPVQLFTYMLMYEGFSHILLNMSAAWVFGQILEQIWGSKRFLFYYILCDMDAGLLQEVVQCTQYMTKLSQYTSVNIGTGIIPISEYLSMMTIVGTPGSVHAILLAFGVLFPNQQLFIFPLPFPIKAKFFVIGYVLIELYADFANNLGGNVARFAHLGGMIFGLTLTTY